MTTNGEDITDDHLEPNALAEAIIVGAIPGSFLFAATLIALWFELTVIWRCRLQNLSAGILLSAIFTELYPLIEHVLGLDGHGHYFVILSMFIGFLCAFLFMVLIDYLPSSEQDSMNHFDYAYGALDSKAMGSPCLRTETMARGDHNWKHFCISKENSTAAGNDLKQVLSVLEDFESGVKEAEVSRNSIEVYRQALESALAQFRNTITNKPPSISLTKQRIILDDLRKIKKATQSIQKDIAKGNHEKRELYFMDLFNQISAATSNMHWELEHIYGYPRPTKHVIAMRNTLDFDGLRPPGCPSSVGTLSEGKLTPHDSMADDSSSAQLFKGLPTIPSVYNQRPTATHYIYKGSPTASPLGSRGRMLSPHSAKNSTPRDIEKHYKRNMRLLFGTLIQVFVCGFLIGLSYTVSARAGYIVSCASTLEMFLMGMAYSHSHQITRISGACTSWSVFMGLFLAPPFTLITATIIGSGLAAAMTLEEYMFHGFMTFGIASLALHMVRTLFVTHVEALKQRSMAGSRSGLSFLGSFLPFIGVYATWALSKVAPDDDNNNAGG